MLCLVEIATCLGTANQSALVKRNLATLLQYLFVTSVQGQILIFMVTVFQTTIVVNARQIFFTELTPVFKYNFKVYFFVAHCTGRIYENL